MEIKKKYQELLQLRKEFKKSEKAQKYYNHLKELNKNDALYGWMFEDDAILTDTMEELDIYNENYLHDILITYVDELHYIIEKGAQLWKT